MLLTEKEMVLSNVNWFKMAREHVNGFQRKMRLALQPISRASGSLRWLIPTKAVLSWRVMYQLLLCKKACPG